MLETKHMGKTFDTKHLRIKQARTLALATAWLICDVNLILLLIITPRSLNSFTLLALFPVSVRP